jgi:hypothetical protein
VASCDCDRSGICTGCKLIAKQEKAEEARRQEEQAERLAWAQRLVGQTVTGVAPGPEGIMIFFPDHVIWWRS